MGGELYYISPEMKSSWITEVESLGFVVEDISDRMTEADRRVFAFVGKLKNGKSERFIQLEVLKSGYMLAVRFAGSGDAEFLKMTLGFRFPSHRIEVKQ